MPEVSFDQLVNEKNFHTLNNSKSKMQYSFGKSKRFNNKNYSSESNLKFYDVPSQKSKRSCTFGIGKRSVWQKINQNPPPGQYTIQSLLGKGLGTHFKSNRNEVKYGSMIELNKNPGPGQYNPEIQQSKHSVYIGQKLKTVIYDPSPGPIYNIKSSLLDENKVLSIYVKRNGTKLFKPNNKKSLKQQFTPGPCQYSLQYLTNKGQKGIGKIARKTFMTYQKRFHSRKESQSLPGPGYYSTFSQFLDQPQSHPRSKEI